MSDQQVSTYVDKETKKRIRMAAAAEDKSVSEWLRDAALEHLEQTQFRISA